jgi:hypothetical protein
LEFAEFVFSFAFIVATILYGFPQIRLPVLALLGAQ